MLNLNILQLAARALAARCDPNDVRECLATFEVQFQVCEPNDLACQCGLVLTQGSVCFDGCPDEALDEFISTYADGVCRRAEAHLLEGDDEGEEPNQFHQQMVEEVEESAGRPKKNRNGWRGRLKGNELEAKPPSSLSSSSSSSSSHTDVFTIQTSPNSKLDKAAAVAPTSHSSASSSSSSKPKATSTTTIAAKKLNETETKEHETGKSETPNKETVVTESSKPMDLHLGSSVADGQKKNATNGRLASATHKDVSPMGGTLKVTIGAVIAGVLGAVFI